VVVAIEAENLWPQANDLRVIHVSRNADDDPVAYLAGARGGTIAGSPKIT
jgi:hypothetical protein